MFTGIFVYLQVDVSFNYLTRTSAILVNVIAIAWMEYGVFFLFPLGFPTPLHNVGLMDL